MKAMRFINNLQAPKRGLVAATASYPIRVHITDMHANSLIEIKSCALCGEEHAPPNRKRGCSL